VKLHFRNDEYITPPGTLIDILPHPFYKNRRSVELAMFNEHRYAFFFWNKWTKEILKKESTTKPPSLITIDWHQDLMSPNAPEKEWLDQLDITSNRDVALYSWANLTDINDGQIMAAAYQNIKGNVYVHCRQGISERHWEDTAFTDRYGNTHTVKKFRKYSDLEGYMLATDESKVYFDIDLDYFTIDNPLNGVGKKFTYMKKKHIEEILNAKRPLITWIFERLEGFTIATEPEHTGGLLMTNKLAGLIDTIFFKPSLFTNYAWRNKHTNWKHF
jgi:hypothetical protein